MNTLQQNEELLQDLQPARGSTPKVFILYTALTDEYTLSPTSGRAGFEDQGDGTYLLTQLPTARVASLRRLESADTYLLYVPQ